MTRIALAVLLFGVTLALGPGCSSQNRVLENDLRQLGLNYYNFHDLNQRGPGSWEELIDFAKQMGEPIEPYDRIRQAGYEVQWGVKFKELPSGLSDDVLAKRPSGGPTLMMDASIRWD